MSFLNAPSELLAILKNNLLDDEDAPPSGFYSAVVERAAKMVRSWKERPAPDRVHFLKAVIDRIKLLCDDFWAWSDSSVREKHAFNDLELILIGLESESSWIAGCNPTSLASKRVLLKKSQCDEGLWMALRPGLKLRMSDAMVTFREEGEDPLVAFTTFTEALLVES